MRKWIITITLLLSQLHWGYAPEVDKRFSEYRSKLILAKNSEFTEEVFIWYLEQQDVLFRDIIVSQARLETGNYTSIIFLRNNNLFGMKHPRIRPTVSTRVQFGHATYPHWTDSVDDYVLWYKYHIHMLDSCYYEFLKEVGYSEDKKYIPKLKHITFKKNKNLISLPQKEIRFVW